MANKPVPKVQESRTMRVRILVTFVIFTVTCSQAIRAASPGGESSSSLTQYVNPFVGSDGGGNTVPGAAVPFGFVELSPDTTNADTSGYSSSGQIIGFSHTHVSGTGGDAKYGNFRVSPTSGALRVGNLRFAKSDESATPGYYAVTLAGDGGRIRCELTATRLVGFERFTFPAGADANIILDASSRVKLAQRATDVEVNVVDDTHISGSASFTGGWNPGPYTLYFWAVFNRPMKRGGTWTANLGSERTFPGQRHIEGDQARNYADQFGAFAVFDTAENRAVEMKLAVSFISVDKARKSLETEAPGWDFDSVRRQAEDEWERVLDKIKISGGTDEQRRIFYTALYRSHYMPHDLTGENVWWQSSEPHYEDFYTLWDTFRTLQPLLTVIESERERDMVRSLVDTYRHTGWLPDARIAGSNGMTQGGSNGDVVVADAMVKGLKGIDYETAYQALVKDAEVESPRPLNEGRQLEDYKRLGYMSLTYTRAAARTLEYAYDDFCIAEVAKALGKTEDAKKYLERSGNWAHLWDAKMRCIRPRYANGTWMENYDCDHEYPDGATEWWDAPFYEGRPIQYSTFVPQDVNGLIRQLGGDQAFTSWLDDFFDRKLYTQGNEPDLLAPWLYIHAGRPDRTAERVRTILAGAYQDARDGLPGNDDAGTMSSWYVWSAIGIFPNAGQPFYYIGSPLFSRITIELEGGRSFVIEARDTSAGNRYVQRAELNGKVLHRAWLTHAELAAGGKLVLDMGPNPSQWGRGDRPPSTSLNAK
jgi:predicted alpha-1,2-mannosidase